MRRLRSSNQLVLGVAIDMRKHNQRNGPAAGSSDPGGQPKKDQRNHRGWRSQAQPAEHGRHQIDTGSAPPDGEQSQPQADRNATQYAISERYDGQGQALLQKLRNRTVERLRESEVAVGQPGQIAEIERGDVVVASPLGANSLLAFSA